MVVVATTIVQKIVVVIIAMEKEIYQTLMDHQEKPNDVKRIVILLMIPVILNIRKKNDFDEDEENTSNILNYEERKKLIKSLSLFTIYIWILTSIIATKF